MTGSGSPCGACKFLRRKCVKGCNFAPYFCHEQGATHFAAIHKIFGASNVSKLLAHLPVSHRSEAAAAISYEAQARLQDPIYGCVSHIFALQQQVVNLQAQLASLKEQAAAQCIMNNSSNSANPNDQKFYGESHSSPNDDLQSWWQNQMAMPQLDAILNNSSNINPYCPSGSMDLSLSPSVEHENPVFREQDLSYGSMDSFEDQPCNKQQWLFQDVGDELQAVAFRHLHLS